MKLYVPQSLYYYAKDFHEGKTYWDVGFHLRL